jgi:hypothetical protein
MSTHRETEIERDEDGRVVAVEERIARPRRGAGFGWGALLGVILITGAMIAFAYTQGSFQNAGARVDSAAQQAEEQIGDRAEAAGDRIESSTDALQERAHN